MIDKYQHRHIYWYQILISAVNKSNIAYENSSCLWKVVPTKTNLLKKLARISMKTTISNLQNYRATVASRTESIQQTTFILIFV